MGGHSHWAGIKHKKAKEDAKKGKTYTKIIKEIVVAVRHGGGDPDSNPRLRKAMDDARNANMPNENVERAVLRGLGKLEGVTIDELMLEGYGPGGVAIMVAATSDSKNRTTGEIRRMFSQHGGNMGEAGCVGWMFNQKGYFEIEKSQTTEDKLLEITLEAGAQDIDSGEKDVYKVTCEMQDFDKVRKAIEGGSITTVMAEITYLPTTVIKVEGNEAEKVISLMEALEDHDDVSNVYANYDIPDDVIAKHS
ncbi:YebC/PmpR family DNA-binding transcriptional regulator [Elusimicrobiota bacterium]